MWLMREIVSVRNVTGCCGGEADGDPGRVGDLKPKILSRIISSKTFEKFLVNSHSELSTLYDASLFP